MKLPDNEVLIVVDLQNDFCPGGALAVPEGDTIIPLVNELIPLFETVVYTQDWHPENHISFSKTPQFTDRSWPPHCVADTSGAELHPRLIRAQNALFVHKGTDPQKEAYSGFQGTELVQTLKEKNIKIVYICGLATDYCVKHTALDAKHEGFEVNVIKDASKGIDIPPGTVEKTFQELEQANITLLTSAGLLDKALQHSSF